MEIIMEIVNELNIKILNNNYDDIRFSISAKS